MNVFALPVHPTLVHPRTGLPLRAVGVGRRGPIWPILGGDETEGEGTPPAGDPPAAPPAAPPATPPAEEPPAPPAGKVEDLPDWAQKLIKDTRGEAAANRTAKAAAEKARTDVLDGIAKALGLKKDEELTPAQLAEKLNKTDAVARQAQVELAVFKAAGKHGADAEALLDSRGFLAKLGELDPSKDDFDTKVASTIKDAVKDNPKLKATQAAGKSSADHAGGSGEGRTRTPRPLADAVASHYAGN